MKKIFPLLISMIIILNISTPALAKTYWQPQTYKDIPGVTQSEIDAIEAAKTQFHSFRYGSLYSTEAYIKSDGTYAGFSVELCKLFSELFGIQFELELYEWGNLLDNMDNGIVHFTGELTPTEERKKAYSMSDEIIERTIKMFTTPQTLASLQNPNNQSIRFAFLQGTTTKQFVVNLYDKPFTSIEVNDYDTAAALLNDNKIDAFFEEGVSEVAFAQYQNISGKEFFPLICSPVSISTKQSELSAFISVIDKYLQNNGMKHLNDLYSNSYYEYSKDQMYQRFTEPEKEYLKLLSSTNKKIKVAYESDNYPICFYNDADKEFQGTAVDVLDEVAMITGLNFESACKPHEPWEDVLAKLDSGKASLISELIQTKEREEKYIWTEKTYSTDKFALISTAQAPNVQLNEVLHMKIGVVRQTIFEDTINLWFPNQSLTKTYSTYEDAFKALAQGEIELLMASRNLLLGQTNYYENAGFKSNLVFNRTINSAFGFKKEDKILCSIVDKSIEFIDTQLISDRWVQKSFDYTDKLNKLRMGYLTVAIIMLIIIIEYVLFQFLKNRKHNMTLESQVHERTIELELASKAKSAFLAHMSHEIRTPLNAIMGMTHIAENSYDDKEKFANSIAQIQAASLHLMGIVNNVLDMSKIDSGKLELCLAPFHFAQAFDEVMAMAHQKCAEKEVTLKCNFETLPDYTLIGDKQRINQVLSSLLVNAIKFSKYGGGVEFLVDVVSQTDDEVCIGFYITDNGIGMTHEQISRLFAAFEQAESSTAVQYGGAGLGLAISQKLVHLMGGEISVVSELGEGSTFAFSITLEKANRTTSNLSGEVAAGCLAGKRILLVDDVSINRIILKEIMAPTCVEIDEATNGQQAVDIIKNSPAGYYNLIFMDIQMPVMDGYTAATAIRNLDREDAKCIPIIAMTSNAYKEDIDNALNAGMDAHVPKPLEIPVLMSAVNKFLTTDVKNV